MASSTKQEQQQKPEPKGNGGKANPKAESKPKRPQRECFLLEWF